MREAGSGGDWVWGGGGGVGSSAGVVEGSRGTEGAGDVRRRERSPGPAARTGRRRWRGGGGLFSLSSRLEQRSGGGCSLPNLAGLMGLPSGDLTCLGGLWRCVVLRLQRGQSSPSICCETRCVVK